MFKTPGYYQNFNFVLKSTKSDFFVLTFVVLFLELIIAQCSAYAHFKEFFLRKKHYSTNKVVHFTRRVVMDRFL